LKLAFHYSSSTRRHRQRSKDGPAGAHQRGQLGAGVVVGQVDVAVAGDHDDAHALHPVDGGPPAVGA
jgi:hypothetical protein